MTLVVADEAEVIIVVDDELDVAVDDKLVLVVALGHSLRTTKNQNRFNRLILF